MEDHENTREQLLKELALLRHRVATLEAVQTEHQRAEEAVRESEERYRLLVESVPQAIWRANANGETSEWNNHWCEYTGQTYEEARGFGWMKALHSDDVERVTERVREAQASGELCQVEYRVRRASDGSYRWHLARALPIKDDDGKITGWFGSVTDIDDQKRIEEELRKNRAILRATIDHLPFDFFAIGMDGHYTLQNATSKGHWGDAVGKLPEAMAGNDENLVLWRENNRRAFAGEKVEGEVTLTIKGETRHLYNILTPIRIDGGICGILGMNVDITERKRAEEGLLRERNRAQQYLDVAAVIMVVLDKDGKIILLNQKGYEILQYPEGTLLGKHWFDTCVPASVRQSVFAVFRQLIAGQLEPVEYYENPVVTHLGEERIIAWNNTLLNDDQGNIVGTLSSGTDITEHKQAEEALRESEERFRQAMEATNDGLWDWNVKSGDVYYSPAYSRIIGYEPAEFANQVQSWINLLHPDDQAKALSVNQACIENRIQHFAIEFRMRAKGGEWKTILGRGKAVCRDRNGRAIRMIGTHVDITDRKRAEEALKQAHDELERRVEERTAELTKANEELAIFRRFAESSSQGFGMARPNGEITYVNPAMSRLLVDGRPEDIIGKHVSTVYSEDYMQRREKEIRPSILRDGHWQGEIVFSHRSGSIIVEQNSFLVRDEQDNPAYFATVLTDITERKRAEEALRHSHDELQAIYDGMVDGLLVTDIETMRFVRVNASICQMLGYSEEELLSLSVGDIHPAEALPHILENICSADKANHAPTGNIPVLRKDGSVFYAEVIGKFLVYNGRPCSMGIFRDITERRQAQEALRQSHDELQAIYDQVEDGIVIVDIEKPEPIRANAAICRMLGYSEQEMKTLLPAQVHPSEAMSKILDHLQAVAQGRVARFDNMPFLRRDGSVFYADVVSSRILYNERFCRISFLHDVTERKRAEEALRHSEETHRGLLEACPDAVVIIELKGKILFASRQAWSLGGLSDSEELVGRSVFDYVIEDDRRRLAKAINRLLETETGRNQEYTVIRRDGTTVPAEISSALSRDATGQPIGVMAVIRDITERKQAEMALRQSHDELRAIYDQVVDGIMIAPVETTSPIRVNLALCRMLGYSEEEVYTLPPERVHPPEVFPKVLEHFEAIKKGLVARIDNLPFLRRDGNIVYADVLSRPIRYDERSCSISFFHDVTERRHAQELLQREHRTLKHLLQSSDHERQTIAYEIHDGLAQQLAGAIMQFQTYAHQKDKNPKLAAKAYDAGMTMLQQGHFEARRLISGVRPPILDESGVLAAVAHLVNEERHQKGPHIELHSEVGFDRLAPILENAIYRIVQEALTNACTHSKSNRVRVELVQHGDDLRIRIQDWGIGFDPGDVEEDRFGLAGIRERARLLGGSTTVESTLGQGTCITVELPLVMRE